MQTLREEARPLSQVTPMDMKHRVKSKQNYGYSRIGVCMDCGADFEDMVTANADARRHTEKTGHTTNVEVATKFHYSAL